MSLSEKFGVGGNKGMRRPPKRRSGSRKEKCPDCGTWHDLGQEHVCILPLSSSAPGAKEAWIKKKEQQRHAGEN